MSNIEKWADEYLLSHIWETDYRNDENVRKAFMAGAARAIEEVLKKETIVTGGTEYQHGCNRFEYWEQYEHEGIIGSRLEEALLEIDRLKAREKEMVREAMGYVADAIIRRTGGGYTNGLLDKVVEQFLRDKNKMTEERGKPFYIFSEDDLNWALEHNENTLNPVRIVAEKAGHNDEDSWFWLLLDSSGKYVALAGWCDYTGWDCQSGITVLGESDTAEGCLPFFPEKEGGREDCHVREIMKGQLEGTIPFGLEPEKIPK